MKSLVQSWQLFHHGNTHIVNFSKMLNFLQGKEFTNEGYADLAEIIGFKTKSFREYYSQKAENSNKEQLNQKLSMLEVSDSEVDNLTYPNFANYWKVSLN